ncbi:MAG: hypothetical protein AAF682_29740 [Planctomycetota bacterium]
MFASKPTFLTRTLRVAGLSAALVCVADAGTHQDTRPASEISFEVPENFDDILGEDLKIGDDVISTMEIKRGIVNGPAGRSLLESAKLQVFIDEEVARRMDEGADNTDSITVSEEEINDAIEEADAMVRDEYVDNPNISKTRDLFPMPEDLWVDQITQTQLFDKLFLPENPNEYPPLTVAALNQQSPDFVDKLKEGWELRQSQENPETDAQGQAIFRQLMRQLIIGALNKSADVRTFKDGLPPEVALEVNGKKVMTDDIWKAMRWKVTKEDVDDAKLWYQRTATLRQALEKEGVYLSDEEFDNAYHEHTDPYKDSPFNIEAVATSFKKFPSAEHYKVHYRLQESFKRMIAEDITEENLQAHVASRAGNLLGLAKVDVEVILLSAYDFQLNAFRPDGWEHAKNRAVEAIQALANGRAWDEVIEEFSEFYEPPLGVSTRDRAAQFSKNKGRFGQKNRNELLQVLGESDWSLFLHGASLTDTIFFDLEVGVPSQPIRGPHGYYVALVKSRTAPISQINTNEDGHRTLVEQDYLTTRFNAYSREILGR